MKSSLSSVILLFGLLLSTLAQTEQYPGVHTYQDLDRQAEVLNFHQIKRNIGYPILTPTAREVFKIHCRVLVDQQGNYIRHVFTRIDHEDLVGPVSVHLPNLTFQPAIKDQEYVCSWVNVPFIFSTAPSSSSVKETSQFRKRHGIEGRRQLEEELILSLMAKESEAAWTESLGIATQLIHHSRRRLYKVEPLLLADFYRARALALLHLGFVKEAHADLNEGLALLDQQHDDYLETRLRAMRVISWMAVGNPSNLIEDYQFLRSEWQLELSWEYWTGLMNSSPLRQAISVQEFDLNSHSLPRELIHTLIGLDQMADHRFREALLSLNEARSTSLPRNWQHMLDLRIAECMRHEGDIEEAINLCQQVMEESPLDPFPHFVKGILLIDAGATGAGTTSLQKALALGLEGKEKLFASLWIDQSTQQLNNISSHIGAE